MNHPGIPKMSLVAQYDDLCRYTKILTAGSEEEFKTFAESQLNCFRKWRESEQEMKQMAGKISRLEEEKKVLNTKNKHLKSLLDTEIAMRAQLESEKSSMERQIVLIKEVLLADNNPIDNEVKEKLVFLSSTRQPPPLKTIEESAGSFYNLSDFDYTDDDLDNVRHSSKTKRSRGKRSSSENKSASKRRKSENKNQAVREEPAADHTNLAKEATTYRSNSEPSETSISVLPERVFVRPVHSSDSEVKSNTYNGQKGDPRSIFGSSPFRRYNTSSKLNRTHVFCNKTVIRTEKCYACGRIISFCKQALKCQDCRVTCHPECKDKCPGPCFPVASTPTKGEVGTIAENTSGTPPMIPSLIVHCVNEIETRGLKETGLYRVPGSVREVKILKEKFLRGRTVPNLSKIDIYAICGTIKEFLGSLKEPLIPRLSWHLFVDAADISDATQSLKVLYKAVCDLPQPNRDTLAFLVLHLQRVAETPESKMPIENLGKIFGPTIVGYSSSDPADCNIVYETKHQCKVMQRLLLISKDHWCNLLHFEPEVSNINIKTSECLSAPPTSRLGPMYGSDTKPKSVQLSRTPLTPRITKPPKAKRFFSPLIKN